MAVVIALVSYCQLERLLMRPMATIVVCGTLTVGFTRNTNQIYMGGSFVAGDVIGVAVDGQQEVLGSQRRRQLEQQQFS
jgi:hypothetical protein